MGAGLAASAARSGVPLAVQDRRLRRQGRVGKLDDIRPASPPAGLLLRARGPHVGHGYPPDALPKAEAVYSQPMLPGMEAGHRRPLPEVPAPRLPRPELRQQSSGSSARATARSTTASARRRPGRRRVAWIASPSPSSGGDVTVDTGVVVRRPAHRHQHHRPGGRGAPLHRADGALMLALATHVDRVGAPRDRRSSGWHRLRSRQRAARPPRARLGDRAGGQPQAVLRRRGARGPAARPCSSSA